MEYMGKIAEGFLNEAGAQILTVLLLAFGSLLGLHRWQQGGKTRQQRQQGGTGARQIQSADRDSDVFQEQIGGDHAWQIQKAGDKDA